ncbi:MAG: hypothetical protein CMJ64_23895 [Planctomycetaceae bacterium]|nr:hypothetical protein [Planctomycetaceae bacterium]
MISIAHVWLLVGFVTRNPPYERAWMLKYIDRPWIADTTYTRSRLKWDCLDGMKLCDRLPTMINRFLQNRRVWDLRSRARNDARYSYTPEKD